MAWILILVAESKQSATNMQEQLLKKYVLNEAGHEIIAANEFLRVIIEESRAVETWRKTWLTPLELTNRYLQAIGSVPAELLKIAKRLFLELYTIKNEHNDTATYWSDYWHNNIAMPFARLMIAENTSPKKEVCDSETETAIKTILEESTTAREARIRNRGYALYKFFKG